MSDNGSDDGHSEKSAQTKALEEEKLSEGIQKDTGGQKDINGKEAEQKESKINTNTQRQKDTEDSSDSDEELSVDAALKVILS